MSTRALAGLRPWHASKLVRLVREGHERRQLMEEPFLDYFFWEATLRCNLHCRHCGSSCGPERPPGELSTEQVLGIFQTIAEDFDPSQIFVSITGGEPLLRHDLYQVVEQFSKWGFETCIVTNGTLLTREVARRLLDVGLGIVSISLDGLRESHEAVRGRGTFRRAIQGVENAAAEGMDIVEVISAIRPQNLPELPDMERVYAAAGANLWRLITIDRMGRAQDQDDLWLDPPQVRQLFDFIQDRRRAWRRGRALLPVSFSCGGFLGVRYEDSVRPMTWQCSAGLTVASVLYDGQVSACPSLPRSWAQGSALETRFSTIWYERFQSFRSHEVRRQGPCATCSWYPICLGGGLHERLAQPEEFCWLDRQGL